MKRRFHPQTRHSKSTILGTLIAGLALALALGFSALAQGTTFTYQGRLNNGGSPVNGWYDFQFGLYGSTNGATVVSGTVPLTLLATPVTNGLFTVTLDFESVAFTGASNWLAIVVRTNSAVLGFNTLAPRQQVTPTPYAITAENALVATTDSGFSGAIAGDVTGTQAATTVQKVGGRHHLHGPQSGQWRERKSGGQHGGAAGCERRD
jgi:hypothetical protein